MNRRIKFKKYKGYIICDRVEKISYDIFYNHPRSEWYDLFKVITIKEYDDDTIDIKLGKRRNEKERINMNLEYLREDFRCDYDIGDIVKFKNTDNPYRGLYVIQNLPLLDNRIDLKKLIEENKYTLGYPIGGWQIMTTPQFVGLTTEGKISGTGYNELYYRITKDDTEFGCKPDELIKVDPSIIDKELYNKLMGIYNNDKMNHMFPMHEHDWDYVD